MASGNLKIGNLTAGPWFADLHATSFQGGREYAYIRAPGNLVPLAAVPLGVEGYGRDEGVANAQTMAASHEMLAMLIDLLKPGSVNGTILEAGRDLLAKLGHDVRRAK